MAEEPRTSRARSRASVRRGALHRVFPPGHDRPRFLEGRLLRAGEVAALLQVSRRSIAAWAQRGLLPFIETPGGHRRFRASDVRALVASLRRSAQLEDLPHVPARPPRSG